jgi:ribosomal protein S12 methylthiotransferase accessory factor
VAWKNAVCEAFAVRSWARSLQLVTPDREFADDFLDVETFADHVHLYSLRRHAGHADFLDASTEVRALAEIPTLPGATVGEQIEALRARLRRAGTSAYLVDLTPPDVRAAGLFAVRAVAPELCPLDASHSARFLGGRRLYEAGWRLGLRSRRLDRVEVNPYPHPFP